MSEIRFSEPLRRFHLRINVAAQLVEFCALWSHNDRALSFNLRNYPP